MKVEYINPFITSLINAFDTMVGCKVRREDVSLKEGINPKHEVSGVIGLSGNAKGTVVLSISKDVALKAAAAMLMEEMTEINDEVVDAIGELTNMVAGRAKAELQEYSLSISLPNVVTGRDYEIRFPTKATPLCVLFESDWGPLSLEVGLTPVVQPAEA